VGGGAPNGGGRVHIEAVRQNLIDTALNNVIRSQPREGDIMRPGYNTKSVTVRVPEAIYHEIQRRMTGNCGQTAVILEALCRAFEIKNPRPRKTTGDNHDSKQ
jgi:hypothetical protein